MNNQLVAAAILIVSGWQLCAAENPLTEGSKKMYEMVRTNVLKSAEEMPEADYKFQPISSVRTFGQLVAHVADGQYEFCSAMVKSDAKNPGIEKTVTSKTELIAALKTSFSYCDKAYAGTTDANAAENVKFFGRDMARLSVLTFNIAHTDEHYGNMTTYLRMKRLTPPSSQK